MRDERNGDAEHMGVKSNAYKILVEMSRVLGRLRHRCEDNIKLDVREIGWWVIYCSHVSQGTNCFKHVMKLQVLYNAENSFPS
jgi:hypothetical protein